MGTWGTRIYEDDTALDIRGEFLQERANGLDTATIEQRILQEYLEKDFPEHNDKVVLALCCVELETGMLSEDIKARSLEVIQSGRDYEFWKQESGSEDAALRKRELTLIRKYIDKYEGKPIKRKSLVQLQQDEVFEPEGQVESAKLDDIDWHVGSVDDSLPEKKQMQYARAHIAAFVYWLIKNDLFSYRETAAKKAGEKVKADQKFIDAFMEKYMDDKLFTDDVIPKAQAFVENYYNGLSDQLYANDVEDIIGTDNMFKKAYAKSDLDAITAKISNQYEQYQIAPFPKIRRKKTSSLFATLVKIVAFIYLVFLFYRYVIDR